MTKTSAEARGVLSTPPLPMGSHNYYYSCKLNLTRYLTEEGTPRFRKDGSLHTKGHRFFNGRRVVRDIVYKVIMDQ